MQDDEFVGESMYLVLHNRFGYFREYWGAGIYGDISNAIPVDLETAKKLAGDDDNKSYFEVETYWQDIHSLTYFGKDHIIGKEFVFIKSNGPMEVMRTGTTLTTFTSKLLYSVKRVMNFKALFFKEDKEYNVINRTTSRERFTDKEGKEMKRRTVLTIAIITILMLLSIPTFAAQPISVLINNASQVNFDVAPMTYNNRTMVPIRGISEALDVDIEYNQETQKIYLVDDDDFCTEFTIGDSNAIQYYLLSNSYNDTRSAWDMTRTGTISTMTMDVSPMIINGRTLVPLRFIGEALECEVEWAAESSTINIVTDSSNQNNYLDLYYEDSMDDSELAVADADNYALHVGDVVRVYGSGVDMFIGTVIGLDITNNYAQINWFDVQYLNRSILDYYENKPSSDFAYTQNIAGVKFYDNQWIEADSLHFYY